MTDEQAQMLAQGKADARALSAQLQQRIWQALEEPAHLGGDAVEWKRVPHVVIDALVTVQLSIFEALIAFDAATELPNARRHVERLKLEVDLLAATLSPDARAPKC